MRSVAVGMLAALVLASSASGQGWIEPVREMPDWGVVKTRSSVVVRVSGRIARVEVEEWFENRGRGMGESDYLYPLPGEAVFSNFSLYQGDQELRGETMDANRARSIYEEIVRTKRDPALIELAGHGLMRARVFPINPGESRRITMRYTQLLGRAGDALQLRYAAGVRQAGQLQPRFAEARPGMPDIVGQARVVRPPVAMTFRVVVESGEEFRDAFSPTHELRNTREDGRLNVTVAEAAQSDLTLFLPLARPVVGISLATHKPSQEDGYFMLTLSPGKAAANAVVARDLTAVVDVSGSMSGEKMEQARSALRQLLGTLAARDRFRLIAFSSDVRSYRNEWTSATREELTGARRWVDDLRAEGGTNIAGALTEAFQADSQDGRLSIVVFVTDGLPSVGEQNPERIAQLAERSRGNARVFAFGVGYDVNTYLLDRLSAAARGTTQYVRPGESVEQAVGLLAAKVQYPVLADLEIAGSPVRLTEVYPRELPDLFSGEEMIVFGRYAARQDVEGELAITGRRGGRTERFATRVELAGHNNANEFIPKLWASRKIGVLSQQIRLNGQNPELVEEIRRLALRHGLLSEFTSYLVQEPMSRPVAQTVGAAGGRGQASAAAPPSASGAVAVERAESNRQARETRSSQDLQASQKALASTAMAAAGQGRDALRPDGQAANQQSGNQQIVAGRRFQSQGGAWVDVAQQASAKTLEVEPFSRAYFDLLRRLPELEPYWTQLQQVTVAGAKVSIAVSAGGRKTITPAELDRLVTDFRGR